jgi:hypothetical protein
MSERTRLIFTVFEAENMQHDGERKWHENGAVVVS